MCLNLKYIEGGRIDTWKYIEQLEILPSAIYWPKGLVANSIVRWCL